MREALRALRRRTAPVRSALGLVGDVLAWSVFLLLVVALLLDPSWGWRAVGAAAVLWCLVSVVVPPFDHGATADDEPCTSCRHPRREHHGPCQACLRE
ncbi:MAG: hypothetical protein PGN07_12130, partial [Aeromicrobium erythreum]